MIATTARRRRQPVAPPTPAAPAEPKLGPQPRAVEAATDQGPDRPAQVARSGALRPATIASGLTGAQRNDVHEKILPVLTTSPSRRLRFGSPCRTTAHIDCMVHFLTSLEDRAARPGKLSALRDHQQRLL
jgi:hypothetical protein